MKTIPLTQGRCIDCGKPVLKTSQKPSKRCSECLIKRKRELGKVSQLKYRQAHRERVLVSSREYMRKARLKNPDRTHVKDRESSLKKNYGITIEKYENMFKLQNGVCAVCKKPKINKRGYLCVDHCHNSEKIRGLLCNKCNVALGLIEDNIETLKSMIKYIQIQ